MPPEYTNELYEQFEVIAHIMNDYQVFLFRVLCLFFKNLKRSKNLQFGVGIEPFDGIDLRRELTLLRGGPILNNIIENMRQKIECNGLYF